ncbi:MAG: ABC transporter ATP-binding protein [Actinomycetota bacterium]|nr:ABC transporter ATP-binding protein [Actinomycetota bacterium]
MSLLEIRDLHSGYGDLPVVKGVSLDVEEGQIVTVVGPNGAGKTTLLKTVTGLIKVWSGSITFDGRDMVGLAPHARPETGLVMVPEGRKLFPFMTVEENLQMGGYTKSARAHLSSGLEEVFELFPVLLERRTQLAGSLSGGEQQMCAIGRAVMARPKLLILDEPSLGLAPIIVERILGLVRQLADRGMTIMLVEQNVHDALDMAQQGFVLEQGQIVMSGTGQELLARDDLQQAYLGV